MIKHLSAALFGASALAPAIDLQHVEHPGEAAGGLQQHCRRPELIVSLNPSG